MKIISAFHDYYDSALAYGFDASRSYLRETRAFEGDAPNPHRPQAARLPDHLELLRSWAAQCAGCETLSARNAENPDRDGRRFSSKPLAFTVGARAFKCLWVSVTVPAEGEGDGVDRRLYSLREDGGLPPPAPQAAANRKILFNGPVFDPAEFAELLGGWHRKALDDKARGKKNSRSMAFFGASFWLDEPVHKGILGQAEWLASAPEPQGLLAAMAAAGCPAAVANAKGQAQENPRLADFQFYRGLDPASCVQEIAMFVSNMANPEKDSTPQDNPGKVASHGFDAASFRKQPTKSAEPRKAKRPHPDKRI